MNRDLRMAGWEIASWTLACLIALVLVSAVVQAKLDQADAARVWKPATQQQRSCAAVWHRGCIPPRR